METVDQLRQSRDALLEFLESRGARIHQDGRVINCPFHDDRNPSATIKQTAGHWRFKCYAGSCGVSGDIFDLMALASGRTPADEMREWRRNVSPSRPAPASAQSRPAPPPERPAQAPPEPKKHDAFASLDAVEKWIMARRGRIEARYDDYNLPGEDFLYIWRVVPQEGKKLFIPAHKTADGYIIGMPPPPHHLYNRHLIKDAAKVLFVEGEKCVIAASSVEDLAFIPTCAPGGSNKAAFVDLSPLAGKTVYLWPDNDAPDPKKQQRAGLNYMRQIAEMLERLEPAPTIFLIDPNECGIPEDGSDIADLIMDWGEDAGEGALRGAILDIIGTAKGIGPAAELQSHLEDIISGRFQSIEWPWPQLTGMANALLPGTVTLLCGDPGCGKSFMLLEALAFWFENDIPVAVMEMEEDRRYHLQRALAQVALNSRLIDPRWIKQNPEAVRAAYTANAAFLNGFGRCIWDAPDELLSLSAVLDWIKCRCAEGRRIVCVDPVTASEQAEKPWIEDMKFMQGAKFAARKSGASIILCTHPKRGRKNQIHMDEMAGSAAWSRFSQTVLWLEHHPENQEVEIVSSSSMFPEDLATMNKTLHMMKTRNGPGNGLGIAFHYVGQTVTFTEKGLIKKSPKKSKTKEKPQ